MQQLDEQVLLVDAFREAVQAKNLIPLSMCLGFSCGTTKRGVKDNVALCREIAAFFDKQPRDLVQKFLGQILVIVQCATMDSHKNKQELLRLGVYNRILTFAKEMKDPIGICLMCDMIKKLFTNNKEAWTQLVTYLKEGDVAVATSACDAIDSLVGKKKENQLLFKDLGAIEQLSRALKRFGTTKVEFFKVAYRALDSLCSDNPSLVEEYARHDGCEISIDMLKAHWEDVDFVVGSCTGIVRLSENHLEFRKRLGELGACELLVRSMKKHEGIQDNQICFQYIIRLLMEDTNENVERFIQCDLPQGMVNALQKHSECKELVRLCMINISSIIRYDPNLVKRFGALGVCRLLVNHSIGMSDKHTITLACLIFGHLAAGDSENRKELHTLGLRKHLNEWMLKESSDALTALNGILEKDPMEGVCGECGKECTLQCERCRKVWYCSKECQRKQWKQSHKMECKEAEAEDLSRVEN